MALFLFMAVVSPTKSWAQDEDSSDEEIIMPAINASPTPPPIIDESDSSVVNDVEEYDG